MPVILPNSQTNCFCEPGPTSGSFMDFCRVLQPGEEIEFCEKNVTPPTPEYHVFVSSGDQNVIVCALEKFIDSTTSPHNRRPKTDFALVGLNPDNSSEIFVVFLEMRSTIRNADTRRIKIKQCKDAISLLCHEAENYQGFHGNQAIHNFVSQIGTNFGNHKVAAAIVPALYSDSRYLSLEHYQLGHKNIIIVPLSDSWFRKPISWQQLLRVMGLI